MDDTRIKKKGRKIHGASWTRDPLGPPFHTNFIWGQRFLQLSLALPERSDLGMTRAIPIGFHHTPSLKKPKKKAPKEDWDKWKVESKKHAVPAVGIKKVKTLRNQLDAMGQKHRKLILSVDGGFTNITCIKNLPHRCDLIGRIRKDAKIFRPVEPTNKPQRGRKRIYGDQLPTPNEIRQDKDIPWQQVKAFAAGKVHEFDVKVVDNIRWKGAGDKQIRLIIVRPLAYRLSKKSRLLYRDPAYIITTSTDLSIEETLQNFVWRWEIELNFRDEKTLLGIGQAQVREKNAASRVPAFLVAAYSYLQISIHKEYGFKQPEAILNPKWQTNKKYKRFTTQKMIGLFRAQLWSEALGINNLSSFKDKSTSFMKPILFGNSLLSAVFHGVK